MSIDYNGHTVRYDARSNTYSRPPVKVFRVCKNGYKRPMVVNDTCPCYKCSIEVKE